MEEFKEHSEELKKQNIDSLTKLKEKGVTWSIKTAYKDKVKIIKEDITNLKVDAVVNAANEVLLGGGGVDGAIHEKAGPTLNEEIIASIPVRPDGSRIYNGEAVLTKGHGLPAKYIVHTVAPYLNEKGLPQPLLLRSCYKSCFQIAETNKFTSIAFPPLAIGFYGYPMLEASQIAFEETFNWLGKNTGKTADIIFCFISDLQFNLAKELYEKNVVKI